MSGRYPARGLTRTGSHDGNTPREEFRQVPPPIRFGQGLKAYAMVTKLFVEINKAYWVRLLVNLGGACWGRKAKTPLIRLLVNLGEAYRGPLGHDPFDQVACQSGRGLLLRSLLPPVKAVCESGL